MNNFQTALRTAIESTLPCPGYWCKVKRTYTDFETYVKIEEVEEKKTFKEFEKDAFSFEGDPVPRESYIDPESNNIFWIYLSREEMVSVLLNWDVDIHYMASVSFLW